MFSCSPTPKKKRHLYAVDVLDIVAEPRGVVHLALEKYSGDLKSRSHRTATRGVGSRNIEGVSSARRFDVIRLEYCHYCKVRGSTSIEIETW